MPTFAEDMPALKERVGLVFGYHLSEAGFVEVKGTAVTNAEWGENHAFLRSVLGERFSWSGRTFYFENRADALIFEVFCT